MRLSASEMACSNLRLPVHVRLSLKDGAFRLLSKSLLFCMRVISYWYFCCQYQYDMTRMQKRRLFLLRSLKAPSFSSGPNARCRVWESLYLLPFLLLLHMSPTMCHHFVVIGHWTVSRQSTLLSCYSQSPRDTQACGQPTRTPCSFHKHHQSLCSGRSVQCCWSHSAYSAPPDSLAVFKGTCF